MLEKVNAVNKAQELVAWFRENGKQETDIWDIEIDWFNPHAYMDETFEYTSQNRWTTWVTAVWKFEDGSYVQIHWEKPSTEKQDCYPNISIVEVEPFEKTVIDYRAVR